MPNADRRRFISFAYGRSRLPRTANELVRLLLCPPSMLMWRMPRTVLVLERVRTCDRGGEEGYPGCMMLPVAHPSPSHVATTTVLLTRVSNCRASSLWPQVHKFKLSLLTDGGGRAEHFLPKSHSCFFHIERTCRTRPAAVSNTSVCFVHDASSGGACFPRW